MLNAALKSTAVILITKYYFTFLGNRISHEFTMHVDKHNYYVL